LVRRLARLTGASFVLDASKSPRRLAALAAHTDLRILAVVLRRNSRDVLAARIKRARRRNRWYVQALAPFYVAWLVRYLLEMRRVLRRVASEEVITIGFPEFLERPRETERRLSAWAGEDLAIRIEGDRLFLRRPQHVFTGNTWIKGLRFGDEPLPIRNPAPDPLGRFEQICFRLAYALVPMLRAWDDMTFNRPR
jgi:hypothetical protein